MKDWFWEQHQEAINHEMNKLSVNKIPVDPVPNKYPVINKIQVLKIHDNATASVRVILENGAINILYGVNTYMDGDIVRPEMDSLMSKLFPAR